MTDDLPPEPPAGAAAHPAGAAKPPSAPAQPLPRPGPTVLEVEHETRYAYASPVELAQHLAYLRPREDAGLQRLLSHSLSIDPVPNHRIDAIDAWGNPRTHFGLARPHRHLLVRSRSRVVPEPSAGTCPADSLAWDDARDLGRYRAPAGRSAAAVDAQAPVPDLGLAARYASPMLPPAVLRDAGLRAYTLASFPPGRPVHLGALDLMHRVHRDFRYAPASTEIHTPVLEAFARREGVCQDFAHLMIGALRGLGLSARYVSGYLLTEPPLGQEKLQGADASHAWLAVACPQPEGASLWLELDPTNDCIPGTGHVRVATGRDYSDVTPLRGVIRGGSSHTLSVRVSTRPGEAA
ncbi:transglutaminase family protein [Piscinibacter sp. Jin2]|uniref:Transglutaminase family protein n=1 Tax=Aquariibacter lacus TaxID=2801332 RepID=A0A9X1BRY0_9BURK|nr:transglutaminase family protein [Piscinibacter lacus]MBL0720424.1 transglutaminase family protein [Piscinibacter lacus]